MGFGEDAEDLHARPRALPINQRYPKQLGPVFERYHRCRLQPIIGYRSQKNSRLGEIYGRGRGVGRGLAVGPGLGVGVAVGVAVGVGVGVPPATAAKISTRPQP